MTGSRRVCEVNVEVFTGTDRRPPPALARPSMVGHPLCLRCVSFSPVHMRSGLGRPQETGHCRSKGGRGRT